MIVVWNGGRERHSIIYALCIILQTKPLAANFQMNVQKQWDHVIGSCNIEKRIKLEIAVCTSDWDSVFNHDGNLGILPWTRAHTISNARTLIKYWQPPTKFDSISFFLISWSGITFNHYAQVKLWEGVAPRSPTRRLEFEARPTESKEVQGLHQPSPHILLLWTIQRWSQWASNPRPRLWVCRSYRLTSRFTSIHIEKLQRTTTCCTSEESRLEVVHSTSDWHLDIMECVHSKQIWLMSWGPFWCCCNTSQDGIQGKSTHILECWDVNIRFLILKPHCWLGYFRTNLK